MVGGFDAFLPLIVGFATAIGVVVVAWLFAVRRKPKLLSPVTPIQAGAAWSVKDSWMTNFGAGTGLTGFLAATFTKLGTGSPPLVPSQDGPSVQILFIGLGAAAALAPVIYASCGRQTYTEPDKNEGTVAGYLLAAFATLFAVGGEMMALGMFVVNAMPQGGARDLLIGFLVIGAAFIALYSIRTMYNVLTVGTTDNASKIARSLLVTDARRSAVL